MGKGTCQLVDPQDRRTPYERLHHGVKDRQSVQGIFLEQLRDQKYVAGFIALRLDRLGLPQELLILIHQPAQTPVCGNQ